MRGIRVSFFERLFPLFLIISGCAVPGKVFAAACVPPATNLVSWWRAETNLLDAWDSNNGAAVVGPTYVIGRVGFGLSNSVVAVADSPSLHFTNGFSVHAWINGSTFTNAGPYTIVSKYEAPFSSVTATQSSFYFGLTNNGHLFFMVSSNGLARTNVSLTSTQALTAGQWYFVAATYDHTHLRLYINGQFVIAKDFFPGIFPGTASLGIGGIPSGFGVPTAFFPFQGIVDEISIDNRALSDAEISAIYNADGAGLCLTAPTLSGPQSQAVPLNEDAVFSVSVRGNRPLSYQWRFNGTNLAGATNSTLYLERVQSNRIGNYSVIVSNQIGFAISSNAALTLLPPLPCVAPPAGIISWWPADHSEADAVGTNHGETVFIEPPFFGNIYATGKVGSAFTTRIIVPNSASLNFGTNADFSWEGWIKVPPTNFPIGREPTNVIVDKFAISVGYSVGYGLSVPDGHLALQLGFAPINPTNSATFTAPGADLRDSHFHHVACTVSRTVPNGSHLYVDGASVLTFDVSHFSGTLSNTSPLALGLSSGGWPGLITNYLTDEMTLYGRALGADEVASIYHAGSGGKCKNPPFILHDPESQVVTETSNATFTVSAGSLGLRYQWRHFNLNLPGATGSSLTLSNVSIADAGPYSVRVTNLFGAITSAVATLTVHRFPVALCSNVVVSADGTCTAFASVNAGSLDPDGGLLSVSQSPPGPYPLGTNSVTLTVTNGNGLSASCGALVAVLDTTPPSIACPVQVMTFEFSDETGTTVNFAISAHDNCSGDVPVISVPPSGSRFPIGTTTVTNTAMDAAGNSASCTFQVTVLGAQSALRHALSQLIALRSTVDRPQDARVLDAAIQNVGDSLDPSLWLDETHITRRHGELVFNDNKAAVQELNRLLQQKNSSVDDATLRDIINRIVKSDRLLALIAIQDGLAAGLDSKKLASAVDEIAKGDGDVLDAQYESAIAHYRDAWKDAVQLTFRITAALSAGRPLLEFEASPGDQFVIETSTNLTDWTELSSVSADADGIVRFGDADSGDFEVRYYRARRLQ